MTTDGTPVKGKPNLKIIVGVAAFMIPLVLVMLYFYMAEQAGVRFEAVRAKLKPIEAELMPEFTTPEDAPGNGASYLKALITTPGLEEFNKELRDTRTSDQDRKIKAAEWHDGHPDWVDAVCALDKYEYIRFRRDFAKGPEMEMPELYQLRNMFRVNRWLMAVLAEKGDVEGCMKLARTSLHTVSIYAEPLEISYLVDIACYMITLGGIGDSIARINDVSLVKELITRLDRELFTPERQTASMKGELVMFGTWIADLSLEKLLSGLDSPSKSAILKPIAKFFPLYVYQEKTRILESFLKIVEISSLPYPECVHAMERFPVPGGIVSNVVIGMWVGMFPRYFTELQRTRTLRECWLAALRVHLYYLENGKLPETLDAIEVYRQQGPPVDHSIGKPLVYMKYDTPFCFRIKSLGEDGKDSGEYLLPAADAATGKLTHKSFGWNNDKEEHIVGIDYYALKSE